MATTASRITGDEGYSPFYYLKITGFPYYSFATVDPTSTAYGSDAWTLPSGYSAIRGMRLPDDTMTQQLRDIVGGIASPERIRLELQDFDATQAQLGATPSSQYKFFGRLFAPGRAISDTSLKIGFLNGDLSASATVGGTFDVTGPDTYAAGGAGIYVYLGGETIEYSGVAKVGNVSTFTILNRNRFPCHASYPPTPYYRVDNGLSAAPIPTANPPVTSQPLVITGRSAALYMGHLRPNGQPETEANALALLVGRIASIHYNAGLFTLELESVLADVETALACPSLSSAAIKNQISLPTAGYRTFWLGVTKKDAFDGTEKDLEHATVTIPAPSGNAFTGTGAINDCCVQINKAIKNLAGSKYVRHRELSCRPEKNASGEYRILFRTATFRGDSDNNYKWFVQHATSSTDYDPAKPVESLLYALGFPPDNVRFISGDSESSGLAAPTFGRQEIVSPKAPASVFVPTTSLTNPSFNLMSDTYSSPGSRFFSTQATSPKERAWVRFGDGQIVELVSKTSGSLTTGQRHPLVLLDADRDYSQTFYYVPNGAEGRVEQVVCTPDAASAPVPLQLGLYARLMCSNWDNTYDGEFDVYPEGVGLGLNALIYKDDWRKAYGTDGLRFAVVDGNTKWLDLFKGIAAEKHLFLTWSPSDADQTAGAIRLRQLAMPAASAAASFVFNDSNRPSVDETTSGDWDFSHMRTGFTIKYGWSYRKNRFDASATFTDGWARSAFQATKLEVIEDRALMLVSVIGSIMNALAASSVYYRYPWLRCSRKVNKTALLLAPGTFHQIIDATIHNPFTGIFGITAGDAVYGVLTKVTKNPALGDVDVEFLIANMQGQRPWAPSARVDFAAASNGYVVATKTLTFVRHYTNNSDATTYDGIDFAAGDKIRLITRDNDGAPTIYSATINTVAADGLTCTLTTDPTAGAGLSASVETVMIYQPYTSCTVTQQAAVSFLGDAPSALIQATARVHRFT